MNLPIVFLAVADAIIRLLDYSAWRRFDIGNEIRMKMLTNKAEGQTPRAQGVLSAVSAVLSDEEDVYREWEAKQWAFAFHREERRKRRLKFRADCGHWVDATEPYRYQVWRINVMPRGVIEQRTDCEFCARADAAY